MGFQEVEPVDEAREITPGLAEKNDMLKELISVVLEEL